MSRASVPRAVVALIAVASLASLVSCKKTVQLTTDQALIQTLAPDVPKIYINFSCDTDTTLGFFDAPSGPAKHAAWAFMRHNGGPKNQIEWIVSQNAQPVTINSITSKGSPAEPFPIDPLNPTGGSPGVSFKAKVKNSAGEDPDSGQDHKDKDYSYAIGLTCDPPGPRLPIHVVIDPEMIVRRP
jgi:hypothetical protein